MDDLRLILLLLGVVIIVGIYAWERRRERTHLWGDDFDDEVDLRPESDLRISPRTGGDEGHASFLSVLRQKRGSSDGSDAEARGSGAPAEADIISLHVVAEAGHAYTGPALFATLDDLALVFGEMRIFHHYGSGELKAERPLFHLANMLEPGYFNPEDRDGFSTRGLSLFMQLPAPLDAEAVFELMLDTAYQLAGLLGGQVLTHDRQPISDEYIKQIRARLRNETQ